MRWAHRTFAIDARSLALFRVLLAGTVLADLALRMADLRAHYSDTGVLPRRLLLELRPYDWYFSVFFANGSVWFAAALFAAGIVLCLLVIAGRWTRLCTAALWLLVLSVQFRNPFLTEGFDVYERTLLFWAMFLPLAACWSFDARGRAPRSVFSAATVAVVAQIMIVYAFTALHKLRYESWSGGIALQNALTGPFYATAFGRALLATPSLLRLATWATLAIELAVAPLVLLSGFVVGARYVVIVSLLLLHATIALTMHVGLFSAVSVAALALLLPATFWQQPRVQRWADRAGALWPFAGRSETAHADGEHQSRTRSRTGAVLRDLAVCAALAYVVWFNVASLPEPKRIPPQPEPIRSLALLLRLNQEWSMFANPSPTASYIVPVGTFADGHDVNLLDGSPVADVPVVTPEGYASMLGGHRWVKFFISLQSSADAQAAYAKYLCAREWPSARLTRVRLVSAAPASSMRRQPFVHDCRDGG